MICYAFSKTNGNFVPRQRRVRRGHFGVIRVQRAKKLNCGLGCRS
jgi:hypothetical protein